MVEPVFISKRRLPKHVMDKLTTLREFVTFERAGFSFAGDTITVKRLHGDNEFQREHTGNGTQDLTEFVKAETATYRNTWIIPLIDELLAYGQGDSE